MRFLAFHQRAQKYQQVADPNDGQPNIDIPFWFGIFAALRNAQQIASSRHDDKEIIAPEDKPSEIAAPKSRPRRALNNIKRSCDEGVATKGENHSRCVEWPKPPEIEKWFEIQ